MARKTAIFGPKRQFSVACRPKTAENVNYEGVCAQRKVNKNHSYPRVWTTVGGGQDRRRVFETQIIAKVIAPKISYLVNPQGGCYGFSRNLLFSKFSKGILKICFSAFGLSRGDQEVAQVGVPVLVNRGGVSYSTKVTMPCICKTFCTELNQLKDLITSSYTWSANIPQTFYVKFCNIYNTITNLGKLFKQNIFIPTWTWLFMKNSFFNARIISE